MEQIYITADHRGFKLKSVLKEYLEKRGYAVVDLGNKRYDPRDDYPDFAKKISVAVTKKKNARGIAICGSGVGICIGANKKKGARAALVCDVKRAKASRVDDNANILCLGADFVTSSKAKNIVLAWLATPFKNIQRYQRRVKKLDRM